MEHPCHPLRVFRVCPAARGQGRLSPGRCRSRTGLLASMKWCWCFHFPLPPAHSCSLSLGEGWTQWYRDKSGGVWDWSAHAPISPQFILSPDQHPDQAWAEYPLYLLTHCLFYLNTNLSLVQGNCVKGILGFMPFGHYSVKCIHSYYRKELRTSFCQGNKPLFGSHCSRLQGGAHRGPHSLKFAVNHRLPFPNPSKWLLVCFKIYPTGGILKVEFRHFLLRNNII